MTPSIEVRTRHCVYWCLQVQSRQRHLLRRVKEFRTTGISGFVFDPHPSWARLAGSLAPKL